MRIPNLEKFIEPVSIEDFKLALHISMAAFVAEFPIEPSEPNEFEFEGTVYCINEDHPLRRVMRALENTFPDKHLALYTRTEALRQINRAEFSRWVKVEGDLLVFEDALVEAATYFPVHKKSGLFRRGLAKEVARIAASQRDGPAGETLCCVTWKTILAPDLAPIPSKNLAPLGSMVCSLTIAERRILQEVA